MVAADLLALGLVFALALAVEAVASRTRLPRVTLLLLMGVVVGPHGAGLLPATWTVHFTWLAPLALTMVGFLLGGRLASLIDGDGVGLAVRASLIVTVATFVVVAGVSWLAGATPVLAVLLASASLATDPAATWEVVLGRGEPGPLGRLLLGIVALDDAWGLLLFSLALAALDLLAGQGGGAVPLLHAGREILGALLLGLLLGRGLGLIAGRVREGEATVVEAVTVVLLCTGLSLWLEVSFLLTAMTAGWVLARTGRHLQEPFHEIAHLEWPLLLMFFVMVGARLDLGALAGLAGLGAVYVLARVVGRVAGGLACGGPRSLAIRQRVWLGLGLLPQAGVAMGVALVAAGRYPAEAEALLGVVTGAVVLFELAGPIFTRWALNAVEGPADSASVRHRDGG